ncbi:MAG TPA: topoisomerase C-terminal repeat-containing protein, partial [Acidimicrobiales bacterium]
PATPLRPPSAVQRELNSQELALYRMVWQRTLASQMADAAGTTVSVRLGAVSAHESTDCEFAASGTTITFPGYRAVYVESGDENGEREALLPPLAVGDDVPVASVTANGHTTSPPARYTEASLVKRLEELGIGRPSTWASIIQTVQDRGYVWKKGQALVPSWSAFAVVRLLEDHFASEVDYSFTARMENDLDEIAAGARARVPFLEAFWFGNGNGAGAGAAAAGNGSTEAEAATGLTALIEAAMANADPAVVNAVPLGKDPDGVEVVVRNGRYGPYVKRGHDTASVPEAVAPDEMTVERALELLAAPKGDEPIGTDPDTGLPVYSKSGRFGPYVQLGDADTLPEGQKPKMASLFKTMSPATLTFDEALELLSLPRTVGTDPGTGEEIVARNGRYGPYLEKGAETRSLGAEDELFTVTVDQALRLFAEPKRRGRQAAAPPLRELGADPVSGKLMLVKGGRYGPYVTDGETNASLREREGDTVAELTDERAAELLQMRRDAGPAKRGRKKAAAKKKAPAKKATGKKAAAKKAPAKRAAGDEAAAKKTTAAKKAPAKKAAAKKAASNP